MEGSSEPSKYFIMNYYSTASKNSNIASMYERQLVALIIFSSLDFTASSLVFSAASMKQRDK